MALAVKLNNEATKKEVRRSLTDGGAVTRNYEKRRLDTPSKENSCQQATYHL